MDEIKVRRTQDMSGGGHWAPLQKKLYFEGAPANIN